VTVVKSTARTIRVFEHERLTINPNIREEQLTDSELTSLYSFNDLHENKYFTNIRNGVKFGSYVGVIQVGKLTLEILPKVDKDDFGINRLNAVNNWHGALLSMLKVCGFIQINSISEANLKRQNNSLLDLYFSQFLDEVEALLHRGLIKKYRSISANTLALKGRLVFSKHITENIVRKERFHTDHSIYNHDHLINQILLVALHTLERVTVNQLLTDRINRLKSNFPVIQTPIITEADFNKLRLNRKSLPYTNALKIAEMIILNYSPAITGGRQQLLALLFNMNTLWENYILTMLKRSSTNFQIKGQAKKYFWEKRSIRPDIYLQNKTSKENFIIDTKWKMITTDKPSDEDLKQIFTYNLYWNSQRSLLLYPKVTQTDGNFGKYHQGHQDGHYCKIAFIDVLGEDGKLNRCIGKDILQKLEK